MKYVVWNEPGQAGQVVINRIPEEEAIRRQRTKGHYDSDQEALLDFLIENWSWLEDVK